MTLGEIKIVMLAACDEADRHHPDEAPPRAFREAIKALPDRALLNTLDPEHRGMIEEALGRVDATEEVGDRTDAQGALGRAALNYTRQIMRAKDHDLPVGSDAVQESLQVLGRAAVSFFVRLANDLGHGHDPVWLIALERELIEELS